MRNNFISALKISLLNLLGFVFIPVLVLVWGYYHVTSAVTIVLMYYVYVGATASAAHEGSPWPSFTKNAFPIVLQRKFFKVQMHIPKELEPEAMEDDAQYMFGMHPHGCVSEFRLIIDGMIYDTFPRLKSWRALAATVLFYLPMIREFALWTHCIDASRKTAHQAMCNGHSIFVVPGGEHEQMLTEYQKEIVYLKKRKGFVRLALQHGVDIVPSYVFGNNDLYNTSKFMFNLRFAIMKKLHVALPIFYGAYGLPASPHRVPLEIVFGKPIVVKEKIESPTPEVVDKYHDLYVKELVRVFEENKEKFGYGDRDLVLL